MLSSLQCCPNRGVQLDGFDLENMLDLAGLTQAVNDVEVLLLAEGDDLTE